MRRRWWLLVSVLVALLCFPPQWYPQSLRLQFAQWFGASSYRPPPESRPAAGETGEEPCPADVSGWRDAQTIEGVEIRRSPTCVVDNPHASSVICLTEAPAES